MCAGLLRVDKIYTPELDHQRLPKVLVHVGKTEAIVRNLICRFAAVIWLKTGKFAAAADPGIHKSCRTNFQSLPRHS